MTIDVLKMFSIDIKWDANKIYVKGNQSYISPSKIVVEGDWSNIAFWLCAGALGDDEIKCTNRKFNSLQGDKAIVNDFVLEKEKKVLVHAYGNELLKDYLRISTGSKDAMKIFLDAFLEIDKE